MPVSQSRQTSWPYYCRTKIISKDFGLKYSLFLLLSNSPRVAKLAQSSVTISFVLFPNKYFFNLHLLILLLPFLSD